MLANIVLLNGRTELRPIKVGQKLVGVRFSSLVIESMEEAVELSKNPRWLFEIAYRFKPVEGQVNGN